MSDADPLDAALLVLAQAIAAGEMAQAGRLLAASPELASARFRKGATRHGAKAYYLDGIGYYVYAGATALHVAAAAYQAEIVPKLIDLGADVRGRNRRGAEPLHAAAVGAPA